MTVARVRAPRSMIGAGFTDVFQLVRLVLVIAAVATTGALGAGCSSSGGGGESCPNDYPMTCPDASPSYANDVAPLVQSHCTTCHGPGHQVPTLQTYDQTVDAGPKMFSQIHACLMPPAPEPPLTAAQRDTILTWLVCGSMNN